MSEGRPEGNTLLAEELQTRATEGKRSTYPWPLSISHAPDVPTAPEDTKPRLEEIRKSLFGEAYAQEQPKAQERFTSDPSAIDKFYDSQGRYAEHLFSRSGEYQASEGEAYRARLDEIRTGLQAEYVGKTQQEREEIFEKSGGNPVATLLFVREKLNGNIPLEQADIHEMESLQAFGERFEANWNLKVLEAKINYLAGKGGERTRAEEEELNRCIVWYSIYKKLYAEADKRMRIAEHSYFQTPRAKRPDNPASPQNIPAAIQETQK